MSSDQGFLAMEDKYAAQGRQGAISVEKYLLCKPPVNAGLQQVVDSSGFKQYVTGTDFTALELVIDARFEGLSGGDKVFVPSDIITNAAWSKKILTIGGKQTIIVPVEHVVAFERV